MEKVVKITTIITATVYLSTAITGFFAFGPNAPELYIDVWPESDMNIFYGIGIVTILIC
jgi:hypothetical protein